MQEEATLSLSLLAERCLHIADEILSAVKQIQDKFSGKRKKWESFRKALQCVWEKQRVTDLETRLGKLRDQLVFHLLSENRYVRSVTLEPED